MPQPISDANQVEELIGWIRDPQEEPRWSWLPLTDGIKSRSEAGKPVAQILAPLDG